MPNYQQDQGNHHCRNNPNKDSDVYWAEHCNDEEVNEYQNSTGDQKP